MKPVVRTRSWSFLLIMETIAFSETAMCRRNLLYYFGEEFRRKACQEMRNCKNPKTKN